MSRPRRSPRWPTSPSSPRCSATFWSGPPRRSAARLLLLLRPLPRPSPTLSLDRAQAAIAYAGVCRAARFERLLKLLLDRIVRLLLEHIDLAVVGRIGARLRIG